MDVLSLIAGFLAGSVAIYLVSYFIKSDGNKVQETTDTKNITSVLDQLWRSHECLLSEMKQDIDSPDFKFHREFYVLKKNWGWSRWGFHREGPCLAYFVEDHDDLPQQLDTLVSYGLLIQIDEPSKNTVRYQLSEKLVKFLRARKEYQ